MIYFNKDVLIFSNKLKKIGPYNNTILYRYINEQSSTTFAKKLTKHKKKK